MAIIGAGNNGLALARQLLLDRPDMTLIVFEKEAGVARHQSSHNSGIVHASLYYEPDSLKARLCTRGMALMRDYCSEHSLSHLFCGKLVVALHEAKVSRLRTLHARALANGIAGLRYLDAAGIREIEPNVRGVAALPRCTRR